VKRDADGPMFLTLEEVARRLRVHYMTAYRYVRLGRLPAEQRRGRWYVAEEHIERLEKVPALTQGRRRTQWPERQRRLVERLLAGDATAAWSTVEQALLSGGTPVDCYLQLLAPALREIGEQWAAGTTSVEQEHRATAAAMRVAGRLGPRFSHRGRRRIGTVILGGAPGDPHILPVTMTADVVRTAGFSVVDLGANVPEESFLEAVQSTDELIALGVSVSTDGTRRGAARAIAAVRQARPGLVLLAGGPALATGDAAHDLGADKWAPNAVVAAEQIVALQELAAPGR
jgi:excisionase family DNA binding protein